MKDLFRSLLSTLGSMLFAVALILMLAIASIAATIFSAKYGEPLAQEKFYQSYWFGALLFLMCINMLASALNRWPFKVRHIGFLLTHVAIVVILIGAFIKIQFGVEGLLVLAEGQSSRVFTMENTPILLVSNTSANDPPLEFSMDFGDEALEPNRTIRIESMGIEILIERYLPNVRRKDAKARIEYVSAPTKKGYRPQPAIRFKLKGKRAQRTEWFRIGTDKKLKIDEKLIRIEYKDKEIDLGFNVQLKEFEIITDSGSSRPADFVSTLIVSDIGEKVISMNRPVTIGKYTLYQSSYFRDEHGDTTVLSVAYDPSRIIVYIGFISMLAGIAIAFFWQQSRPKFPAPVKEEAA